MARAYDLVVVGTGSAASSVASRCRAAGRTVAVIDSRPFGGTCALRGCDPKKVLVGAGEALDGIHRLTGKGIEAEGARIDWARLMAFKRSVIAAFPEISEKSFAKQGVDAFHGRARFTGPNTIAVGGQTLEGRHIVVAAGAKPASLTIPGAAHLVTSEQFLELDYLPPRIVFVGGGYISFEFAHVAIRAGRAVSILHRGTRPLPLFDPDLVDLLVARTRALGIDVRVGAEVTRIEQRSDGFGVEASIAGQMRVFDADLVVHGAGRVPEIDDLGLDAAGVTWDLRGVAVNKYLQSVSNAAVYAAGDAAASGGPRLTPVAGYEGRIAAMNILEGNHLTPDYSVVPSVVFTVPPLASVGLRQDAATEQGVRFQTRFEQTASWYSSRRVGEQTSAFKMLVDEETGRVLGAHLLGPHADEVVNLFAMAMRAGFTSRDIKDMLFSYPTLASDIRYMV